ncbi:hypothetical protein UF75_3373 [Desulfosporosinus sp. I2]|nr:hypothetical protein UF75_3373 [Desulfosporosinus sp. I2]
MGEHWLWLEPDSWELLEGIPSPVIGAHFVPTEWKAMFAGLD